MKYATIDEAGRYVGRSSLPTTMDGYRSVMWDQPLDDARRWVWDGAAFREAQTSQAELTAKAWAEVRRARSLLLGQSDWTQGADSPLSPEARAAWASYRQALRDVTLQPDPLAITWPTPPL